MLREWASASRERRELLAEISAILAEAAAETGGKRGETPTHPRNSGAAAFQPREAGSGLLAGGGQAIERMLSELVKPPPPNGGLAPPPKSAPGVRVPEIPRQPLPRERVAVTPERKAAAELALQKAMFHRGQIEKCISAKDHAAAVLHLGRVVSALESWSGSGLEGSDDRGSRLLASAVESLPPKVVLTAEVSGAVERLWARLDSAEEEEEEEEEGQSTASGIGVLAEAKAVVKGRVMVLIGGDVREVRRLALQRDLGLSEVRWLRSTPTKPATRFDSDIKRADVGFVLLAIRWVRHSTGYAVAEACERAAKPLVRVPGGLGSNSVAAAIMSQVGRALAKD